MQVRGLPSPLRILLVLCFTLIAARVMPAAAPEFAVAAANVTMPSSGNGQSSYKVTGIPMNGNLAVTCQYSGPATQASIPNCSYGPIASIPVTPGQTVTGVVYFFPAGVAVPLETGRRSQGPAAGLALAGAVLLGFGLRRRARNWLALVVLAAGSLAAVSGLSACVAGMNGMTPGTYSYTITAGVFGTLNNLAAGTSTTINVTVP